MEDQIQMDYQDEDIKLDKIRKQIEFYLSDANIRKDKFIQQLLQSDDGKLEERKFVDLEKFLKFNRITQMTGEVNDLKNALKDSKTLELNGNCVRRKNSIDYEKNADKCTVYIEQLPEEVDHDWLKNLFLNFGQVEHVSLPKFKENKKAKGFAFIEFDNEETAIKTCEFFNFLSFHKGLEEKSFESSQTLSDELIDHLRLNKAEVDNNVNYRKRSNDEELSGDFKRIKSENKKKDDEKNGNKIQVYNDDQKNSIIRLLEKFKDNQNINQLIKLRVMSKEKWLVFKNKFFNLKKKQTNRIKKFPNSSKPNKAIEMKIEDEEFRLENGLIVKLDYKKSKITDEEALFKSYLRKIDSDSIAYIDLKPDLNQCFLRFKEPQSAINYLEKNQLKELGNATIIKDEEEKDYWSTIRQSLLNKKKKKDQKSTNDANKKNDFKNNQNNNHSSNQKNELKLFTDYEKGLIIKLQMDIELNKELSEPELKKKIKSCLNNSYISYIDLDTSIYNIFLTGELIRKTIFIRCKSSDCTKKVIESDQFKELGQYEILENKEELNYWQRIKECSRKKKSKK